MDKNVILRFRKDQVGQISIKNTKNYQIITSTALRSLERSASNTGASSTQFKGIYIHPSVNVEYLIFIKVKKEPPLTAEHKKPIFIGPELTTTNQLKNGDLMCSVMSRSLISMGRTGLDIICATKGKMNCLIVAEGCKWRIDSLGLFFS